LSEQWKSVVGFEAYYEVSDCGRVRSKARFSSNGREVLPCVLRHHIGTHGYASVRLCVNGSKSTRNIHQLVLAAFVGPANGMEARHLDGNKIKNRLHNLKYGTGKENAADRRLHGRERMMWEKGEANPFAVLTDEDIRRIRAWPPRKPGLSAQFPQVSKNTVHQARAGRSWKHVV